MFLHYVHYLFIAIIMSLGLCMVINCSNLFKKLIGLSIFQSSLIFLYVSLSFIDEAAIPIIKSDIDCYVNPLPHVLMLTAIVVGIATFSVGLALLVNIKNNFGSIDLHEISSVNK